MKFQGGHKKLGGRQKGTPNKDTRTLLEICEQRNLNVFEAMVELAIVEEDDCKKFDRLKEIAQYLYPKRKAIEHSGEIKNPYLEKSEKELEELVKEKIK